MNIYCNISMFFLKAEKRVKTGLSDLIQVIHDKDIKSIALPPLGTGLGGLEKKIERN